MNRIISSLICLIALTMQAKVYHFTPADSSALKKTLSNEALMPGDEIILRDGDYHNLGHIDISARGTSSDSITIRAEHPGKAVISGLTEIKITGRNIHLRDLMFKKAYAKDLCIIEFGRGDSIYASGCRISNCVIDDCNHPDRSEKAVKGVKPITVSEYWIALHGRNNRIDHCYFANKRVGGLVIQVWLSEDDCINNHLIDHNLFGYRQPYGGNGAETIRIGNSWSSQLESKTLVQNNVFLRCDGENEIISVKAGYNIIRNNLFFESRGGLVCRHGHNNIIEDNTIVGNNIPGTAGIRLINQGHVVYKNFCSRLADFGLLVRMGVFEKPDSKTDLEKEPLTSYHRAENINIAENSFIDCKLIDLGSGYGDKSPRNVRLSGNYFCNAVPNIRIVKPELTLSGFDFIDNFYYWANGEITSLKGFIRLDNPRPVKAVERERVLKSLNHVGAAWYAPNNDDIKYIAGKYIN